MGLGSSIVLSVFSAIVHTAETDKDREQKAEQWMLIFLARTVSCFAEVGRARLKATTPRPSP